LSDELKQCNNKCHTAAPHSVIFHGHLFIS
jgi:hypothetical protein